jgi:DNA-binding beta-propeller fold protein YncE
VVGAETRTAAAVASTGTKKRIAFDDAAKVLYVANAGDGTNGKVQRHRQANASALAADGSDEIALTNVHILVLSPDGKTLVVLAGTSYKLVDTATFTLKATQPTAVAPSAFVVGLEVIQPEHVIALAQDTMFLQPAILDLATGTATTLRLDPARRERRLPARVLGDPDPGPGRGRAAHRLGR